MDPPAVRLSNRTTNHTDTRMGHAKSTDPNIFILDRWHKALKAEIDALANRDVAEEAEEAELLEAQPGPGNA